MSFLFPAAFFLSVLGVAIVALYLRRPRRRRQDVSTLFFWQKILEKQPSRWFLGKLRNPLSLLLQLLILCLLLLALANPEFQSLHGRTSTVVVVDARARMQAGKTFAEAMAAARSLAAQAGPGREVAILAIEGSPRVVASFTDDSRALREKLDTLSPTDAGGGLEDTLALAERLLESREGNRDLVLVSDRPLVDRKDLRQILVGQPQDNVAVLALARRPLPASPQSAGLFARIGNFSAEAKEVELELALDGRPFDLRKFRIGPGQTADYSTILPEERLSRSRGFLEARLTAPDSLASDDVARAMVPPSEPLRVLLISSGNPFLEGALKADPGIHIEVLEPSAWRPDLGAGFAAVIFDDWVPDGVTLESLGQGNFFFFGRSPFDSGDPKTTSSPEATTSRHPLLWNIDWAGMRVREARELTFPTDARWRVETPLNSGGRPLLASLERTDGQRIVVAAFPVGQSNLPLRAGFPLFISNAIHWLGKKEAVPESAYKAGQTYRAEEEDSLSARPVLRVPASDDVIEMVKAPLKLLTNGYYQVHTGSGTSWIAVNTSDSGESDLRAAVSNRNLLTQGSGGFSLKVWQWLALAALCLILLEWYLHHRRITE